MRCAGVVLNGYSEAGVHAVRSGQGCGWGWRCAEAERKAERETERKTGLVFAGVSLKENFYEREQRKAADG